MKNIGKIILAVFFIFLTALPVLAVGERVVTREENNQGTQSGLTKTIREEVKNEFKEKIATLSGKLEARKKEVIKNQFNFIIRRLKAATSRLNKIVIRIESRIDKIEANDKKIDLAAAKTELAKAKINLTKNNTEIEALQTEMETILEGDTPKEDFKEIKTKINEVKKSLLETRKALIKIIGEIKGLRIGQIATPSAAIKETE
jgi:hypothetical protein